MINNNNIQDKLTKLKDGEIKCIDNAQYFLTKIKKNNEKLNIFLQINPEIETIAKQLDIKREKGDKLGELYGLCFGIKANIAVKGLNTSCSSKTLENYESSFDAEVIKKIKQEDGIILGILNCDEFASGSSGETSAFGPCLNPKNINRIPGGSSSGSAASVAAEFTDISLGSDTGGSIRNPASHCGVIGIKPSYGRVSRYGLIDLSMSLDQIGPISQDIYGSAKVMEIISGYSKNDAITKDIKVLKYTESLNSKNKYKIGVIKSFNELIEDSRIKKIYETKIQKLKQEGHKIIELDIKNINLAVQAYYPIVYTEFFSGTRKFDGLKYGKKIEDNCGKEVLRRILGGKEISKSEFEGAYYKKALKVKEIIAKEFEKAFQKVDIIISPVTPNIPQKLGEKMSVEEIYAADAFTIPANLAGICGGVISKDRIKEEDGEIYIGIQVLADKFREDLMFSGLSILNELK